MHCSYCRISSQHPFTRRLFLISSRTRCSVAPPPPPPPPPKSMREKFRDFRTGRSFKYWVIGGTVFATWMGYYGMKSYKQRCIDIEILPPLPTHVMVSRDKDMTSLFERYNRQSSFFGGGEKIKKLLIMGASGSGKTVLTHDFAKLLLGSQHGKYKLPKSKILVFLRGDTEESFLTTLKAFAAKCKIKPSELDEASGKRFSELAFYEQCDALLTSIQEKLKKHPGWIIVVDDVQITSPSSVVDIVNHWFLSEREGDEWSSGSVFVVHDGVEKGMPKKMNDQHKHANLGLDKSDAYKLLLEVVNIDRNLPISDASSSLITKLGSNPLAVVCVGILLRERLSLKEAIGIDSAIKDLHNEIDAHLDAVRKDNAHITEYLTSKSGSKLVTVETLIAMVTKHLYAKDRYIWYGFDMLSTIAPGTPVPQSLLARHLKNPLFKLPPLNQSQLGNQFFNKQKNDLEIVQKNADEFEPKGKAWSTKNLSEYVRKAKEGVMTGVNTLKDIYNLVYGELPKLPEKNDGLDMFRDCPLLHTSVIGPGDVKTVSMHPLVYNVARQYLLSTTVPNMENDYLIENQLRYLNQSWYKRLTNFSEQTSLHNLRSSIGHARNPALGQPTAQSVPNNIAPPQPEVIPKPVLDRYNRGIDITSVFKFQPFAGKTEEFWTLKDIDRYHYLQDHVTRVCRSLCEDISVAKGDTAGRSTKNVLLFHLQYMLNNHPLPLLDHKHQVDAFLTVATCYSGLYNDLSRSQSMLEDVLNLQKNENSSDSLDVARTMSKLASIYQQNEDYSQAKSLLEEAAEFHEAERRKSGDYRESLEFGKLLGQLGVVYGSLNMKREAKEAIERSLMLKQMQPPDLTDDPKSKQYGADFSTSLTDLGHAYVSLGMPLYGKKILDLALAAQKNLLGENHPEVVRTLTVLAVAHLMQGNNEESKKLRFEAGKIQNGINALPMY